MGSHLYIGDLETHKEIKGFYEYRIQFLDGYEEFLSLEELEIGLKWIILKSKIKSRGICWDLKEIRKMLNDIDYKGEDESMSLNDLFISVRSYLGHYTKNIAIDNSSLEDTYILLSHAYKTSQKNMEEDFTEKILNSVRPFFIEGKHYLYTI